MPLRTRWVLAGLATVALLFVFVLGYAAGATSTIVRWSSDPPPQVGIGDAIYVSGPPAPPFAVSPAHP